MERQRERGREISHNLARLVENGEKCRFIKTKYVVDPKIDYISDQCCGVGIGSSSGTGSRPQIKEIGLYNLDSPDTAAKSNIFLSIENILCEP